MTFAPAAPSTRPAPDAAVRQTSRNAICSMTGKERPARKEPELDGFPPAPEAIKPSPWFLRMPVLHGPPQVLGLT